jgi:predicted negative regulator of RcsB-dependent stress response
MENSELIRAWLNGELEGEARAAFEKRMAEDAEFAEEVSFARNLAASLRYERQMAIREKLAAIRERDKAQKVQEEDAGPAPAPAKVRPIRRWMLVAAGVALLVVAGIFVPWSAWFSPQPVVSIPKPPGREGETKPGDGVKSETTSKPPPKASDIPKKIEPDSKTGTAEALQFAGRYEQEDAAELSGFINDLNARGIAGSSADRRRLAGILNLHQVGQFETCRDSLLVFDSQDRIANQLAKLYLGVNWLKLGDADKGIAILQPLAESENDFREMAQWHLGMAYLAKSDKDKALSVFKQLADSVSDPQYAERATSIIDFMNE